MTPKIVSRRVFMCRDHQFVIDCAGYGDGKGGKASVRHSPGQRKEGCKECDGAILEMWDFIKPEPG